MSSCGRDEGIKMILKCAIKNCLFRLMTGVGIEVVFGECIHSWANAMTNANFAYLKVYSKFSFPWGLSLKKSKWEEVVSIGRRLLYLRFSILLDRKKV